MDPTPETPEQTESSSENDSGSEDESNDMEREIQVEFEARTPEERDLPGVISLLKQCFRGTEGEVFGLATIIRLKGSDIGDMIVRHMSKSVSTTDRRQFHLIHHRLRHQ